LTAPAEGRIGPNALLQLIPVLKAAMRARLTAQLFARARAGMDRVPQDAMIVAGPVALVHQSIRARLPDRAPALLRQVGRGTGDYILARRIPKRTQRLLRLLPRRLSAWVLAQAIARNAWTFAGSGRFRSVSLRPLMFEIADNAVVRGEVAVRPICDWHGAVFERLFAELTDPQVTVTETACCACGASACRFELRFS